MSENNDIYSYNKEQMTYIKNLFNPSYNLYQVYNISTLFIITIYIESDVTRKN